MRYTIAAFVALFLAVPGFSQDASPENLLNGLKDKWASIQDYHCKLRSRNRLGDQKDEKKMEFWFKQPQQIRTEILDGEKKGSVLTRDADGKIKGKKGGVLGLVSVTLGEDDERIRNLRGRKFYYADWGSVVKEYFAYHKEGCKFTVLPDEKFNGVPCHVLQADLTKPKERVTRDQIWVDAKNNLILCRKQFEGEVLVNEVAWWDIELNTGIPDGTFKL
jgi:outer membrane lipoprotein-sorting protein